MGHKLAYKNIESVCKDSRQQAMASRTGKLARRVCVFRLQIIWLRSTGEDVSASFKSNYEPEIIFYPALISMIIKFNPKIV